MKYVILLLFIFSCQVQQKPQTKVMEKRRPIQNDAIINRMQAQTAEGTPEYD
jgi:hypothetical protein